MKNQNLIWYASYGLSLCKERFHYYILGGKLKGSFKYYEGCADKTLPRCTKSGEIYRELYFAKKSSTWDNGGVAFIKTEEDIVCYLFSKDGVRNSYTKEELKNCWR